MKLLVLTTTFSRFKGDWVLPSLDVGVKELAKTNEVLVISSGGTNTKDIEIRDNMKIIRFNYFKKSLQTLTYTGGMLGLTRKSLLAKLQIPFFLISFMLKAFKHGRSYDVIHAHWSPSAIIAIPLKIFYKKPVVLSFLGGDIRAIPKWFNKLAIKYSDVVLAPVPTVQEYTKELGGEDKISTIKYCYDYDRFDKKDDISEFKKEFNLKNEKIVSFIGRMDEFKDPITFVKSIPYVLKKNKNIKFFIVGYGFLLDDVKKLVKKLNLEKNVIITGPRKDINVILEASDIFINLSPEENFFSVAIQEAIAKHVPCLLTNAGRTEEIFTHKKDCYLVNPKKPKEAADAVIELLNDENLRKKLSENGYKLLKKHGFTRDAVIGGLNSLYTKLKNKK
ncbi:hypothetical protein CL617_03485 [archaeon]|nr:hypothetical protein [archaeon]